MTDDTDSEVAAGCLLACLLAALAVRGRMGLQMQMQMQTQRRRNADADGAE